MYRWFALFVGLVFGLSACGEGPNDVAATAGGPTSIGSSADSDASDDTAPTSGAEERVSDLRSLSVDDFRVARDGLELGDLPGLGGCRPDEPSVSGSAVLGSLDRLEAPERDALIERGSSPLGAVVEEILFEFPDVTAERLTNFDVAVARPALDGTETPDELRNDLALLNADFESETSLSVFLVEPDTNSIRAAFDLQSAEQRLWVVHSYRVCQDAVYDPVPIAEDNGQGDD